MGHGQPHPSPPDFSVPGPGIDGRHLVLPEGDHAELGRLTEVTGYWNVFSDQGLANVYRETGRTAQAREYYERAIAVFKEHYGPGHPYVTETQAEYDELKARTAGR